MLVLGRIATSIASGHATLELADLRIDLGFGKKPTPRPIRRLHWPGCKLPVFSDDAISRLQSVAGGLPRRVNQLAALPPVAGAGRGLPRIDADTIEAVYHASAVDAVA